MLRTVTALFVRSDSVYKQMAGVDWGTCGCGCGKPTKIASRTRSEIDHVKGQPQPFLVGHRAPETDPQVLAARRLSEREYKAEWRRKNAERLRAKDAAYRVANRDRRLAQQAAWYAENALRVRDVQRQWVARNPTKVRAIHTRYARAHPEKARVHAQNRQARKRDNGGRLSTDIVERLLRLQKGKCACCKRLLGKRFQLDHIEPLARGGMNIDSNMQLLTERCNKQKSARDPLDFMQQRGFLL